MCIGCCAEEQFGAEVGGFAGMLRERGIVADGERHFEFFRAREDGHMGAGVPRFDWDL
jgi:hypothetical protein